MKGVQCYERFGGIALKNHTFSFSFFHFITVTIAILIQFQEFFCFVLRNTIFA